MTTIYLVRHAHAEWNRDENRPLSERGRAGAAAIGELLSSSPIDAIYSSPARRALETIEGLAHRLQLEPVAEPDLRERELLVEHGTQFEAAVKRTWVAPASASAGSESNEMAPARGLAATRRILDAHRERHTVVATHGNLLTLILNGFQPTYGFDFWRALTFPDAYELRFQEASLVDVRRIWNGAA
jgi:2,3-bisphosphoglycerate-dependent phosphoglycerate mutase